MESTIISNTSANTKHSKFTGQKKLPSSSSANLQEAMTEARSPVAQPESKRRKVRKGTQSCWECKRRKVRCIFSATRDTICQNCRRRGTACNSQQHPDVPVPSFSGSNQIQARLGRVEELIERLGNRAVVAHISNTPAKDPSEGHLTELDSGSLVSHTDDFDSGIPTPTASAVEASASFSCSGRNIVVRFSRRQALTADMF